MARADDDRWWGRLLDSTDRGFLRLLASRLQDGTDADDLAQEVYLRLLRVDDVQLIREPGEYAMRIASNVAAERGRLSRNRRIHTHMDCLRDQVGADRGPFEQTLHAQEMSVLSSALAGLSPTRRAILLLHKRDGMTYEEIASFVGLSVAMVGKHLAKALKFCADYSAQTQSKDRR